MFHAEEMAELAREDRVVGDIPVVSSSGVTGYHDTKKADGQGVVPGPYSTLGEVYYIERSYWPHNTAFFVVVFKGHSPRVVRLVLQHVIRKAQNNIAAVRGPNRNVIHKFSVLWPTDRLRAQFSDFVKPILEELAVLRMINEKLGRARDLLLPRLMSGEVSA